MEFKVYLAYLQYKNNPSKDNPLKNNRSKKKREKNIFSKKIIQLTMVWDNNNFKIQEFYITQTTIIPNKNLIIKKIIFISMIPNI